MKRILIFLIIFNLFLLGNVFSAKNKNEEPILTQIKNFEDKMYILAVLDKLNASPAQINLLWKHNAIVQDICKEYQTNKINILKEQIEAFEHFKKEDYKNVGFSEKVEKSAAEAKNKEKESFKKYTEKVNSISKEAECLFTTEQNTVFSLNRRDIIEQYMQKHGVKKKENLKENQPREVSKEKAIIQQITEIHKDQYGELNPLSRFLTSPVLYEILSKKKQIDSISDSNTNHLKTSNEKDIIKPTEKIIALQTSEESSEELENRVDEIRADINLLNLLNGLNVTPEQSKVIIAQASELKKHYENCKSEVNIEKAQEYINLLNSTIDYMEKGQNIPIPIQRKLKEVKNQIVKPSDYPKPNLTNNVAAIENVLTDAQKEVIKTYKPCLIPPKNLRDPVRAGQAHDNTPGIKMLERIRQTPKKTFNTRTEQIADKTLSRIEANGGKWESEVRPKKVEDLKKCLIEAYNLSDVEFELHKSELADKITSFSKKEYLEDELEDIEGFGEKQIREKIRINLLNPRIIDVLQTQLSQGNLNAGKKQSAKQ